MSIDLRFSKLTNMDGQEVSPDTTCLNLGYNDLTDLPGLDLPNLKVLRLHENKFETLPEIVFSFKELEELNAHNIRNISMTRKEFPKLKYLTINSKNNTIMPEIIYQDCEKLKVLI